MQGAHDVFRVATLDFSQKAHAFVGDSGPPDAAVEVSFFLPEASPKNSNDGWPSPNLGKEVPSLALKGKKRVREGHLVIECDFFRGQIEAGSNRFAARPQALRSHGCRTLLVDIDPEPNCAVRRSYPPS